MYAVNDIPFDSFLSAVEYAKQTNSDVFEVATGLRRWTPDIKSDSKKQRMYQERLAAYQAYQKLINSREIK